MELLLQHYLNHTSAFSFKDVTLIQISNLFSAIKLNLYIHVIQIRTNMSSLDIE